MTELPIPRFQIGHRVWFASTTEERKKLTCPDCLGTHQWKVITPAGKELISRCYRCNGYDLSYTEVAPRVESFTVGRIRTDSGGRASSWGDESVQYQPDGGSCSLYNNDVIFGTEEEAAIVAKLKAAKRNEELQKDTDWRSRMDRAIEFSQYDIEQALVKNYTDQLYTANQAIECMLDALLDLDDYPYAGCHTADSPLGEYESTYDGKLTAFMKRAVQDTVVRHTYNPKVIQRLVTLREEREKECHC